MLRMRACANEQAGRRVGSADAHDLELAAAGGLSDRSDLNQAMGPDRCEKAIEIRQPIGLHPGDVEGRPRHLDAKLHAVSGQAVGRNGLPRPAVLRDRHGLQLAGNGTGLAVPDVVEVDELKRELRPRPGVDPDVHVPGGAIGRCALVVVQQVQADDAVGEVVPERRRVFETGVDVLQAGVRRRRSGGL